METNRRDKILLLVYCGDVCAIGLLANDLEMNILAHATENDQRNAQECGLDTSV